jgi:pyruvate-ferredoxin/flavodoxin oxidoreductase
MMRATIDGNEATAWVAFRCSEVCCIFPITPSSTMAELADEWSSKGRTNLWGTVPAVVEMQSEGGAAGALHGALQGGALGTTFTASQGLLLMIPNMYKIAGELTSAVVHVAARSLAAQALSIFGDHSDVMAVRQTGFALLAAASVQEAHDLALVAHAATLETRVPFALLRRLSHLARAADDRDARGRGRARADLGRGRSGASRAGAVAERPFIRGTAQNPDIYFQARERHPFYARVPDRAGRDGPTGERTGRRYHLVDYSGHPEAERVVVVMGSGGRPARDGRLPASAGGTGAWRSSGSTGPSPRASWRERCPERPAGRRTGPTRPSLSASRCSWTCSRRERMHGTREREAMPTVIGGRYGLSSKEFTPGMVAGVFEELAREQPMRRSRSGSTTTSRKRA